MTAGLSVPTLASIWDYLTFTGWSVRSTGVAGTLASNGAIEIGVPRSPDDDLIRGVIERIAIAEGRSPSELTQQIRYLHFDVAFLRAANNYRITDTIPLEAAATIIASTRTMLRSTATTARKLRGQIRTYSRCGDEVVKETLMGHTEKGSFVIPVLIPIPAPKHDPDKRQPTIESLDVHRVPPEPFPRRVMRTFAQSLNAITTLVVNPAKDPDRNEIHELVYRGVSREFCVALSQILSQPAVAEFSTVVQWTPTIPTPGALPKEITIDADAADLVTRVATRLRQTKIEPAGVFTGTIVELRHEGDDPFGEIAVSTVRTGRSSEIRVRLPFGHYAEAWEWHRAGQSIIVEGKIKRRPGKPLTVERPTRCEPVETSLLP